MAVPLWLLYELGILLARFLAKQAPPSEEYQVMTDEQMERDFDSVEAQQKEL